MHEKTYEANLTGPTWKDVFEQIRAVMNEYNLDINEIRSMKIEPSSITVETIYRRSDYAEKD